MEKDKRFEKLPVWAKDYIGNIESEIRKLKAENTALKEWEEHNKSRVSVHPILQQSHFYLNESDKIEFDLGESNEWHENVTVLLEKDHLRISLIDMVIKPVVSNVIEIHRSKK